LGIGLTDAQASAVRNDGLTVKIAVVPDAGASVNQMRKHRRRGTTGRRVEIAVVSDACASG
jgi:hypothetical protein